MPELRTALRGKLETLMETLNEQFGTAAEFDDPRGGIFLWVKLPDNVDTMKLYQAALKAGVAINPGPEWSTDAKHAGSRLRICFASPTQAADPRRHRDPRRGLPQGVRRADAQRECGAGAGVSRFYLVP